MNAAVMDLEFSETPMAAETARYARTIKASKKIRWDIDHDVIRGRDFDYSQTFLPDGLSLASQVPFLSADERRFMSQVQGRTYAYLFGLVERFIGAKVLERSGRHFLGNQVALEALVRFGDEEIKHQELFRRIEAMMDAQMPPGYRRMADANAVAQVVLRKSTWSVLALTTLIELFVQMHYDQSIAPEASLSPLWKDVFKYHWMDEAQHVVIDELEWVAENHRLSAGQKEFVVDDLISLVDAVDGILQVQSDADAEYFVANAGRSFSEQESRAVSLHFLKAYRWQYIISGVQHPHFGRLLSDMTTQAQMWRIHAALAPIVQS